MVVSAKGDAYQAAPKSILSHVPTPGVIPKKDLHSSCRSRADGLADGRSMCRKSLPTFESQQSQLECCFALIGDDRCPGKAGAARRILSAHLFFDAEQCECEDEEHSG